AAGTATLPIAAAHFNRIAEYGLVANLAAVPVMGMAVMPAGVIAALLAPLGLAAPALWVMEEGCRFILLVAKLVAGLDGAVVPVPAPAGWILPSLGLGALLLALTRPPWLRGLGVLALAGGLVGWTLADRPLLLIADEGTLVGLMTPSGRALSKAKGAGFVASSWLEDDGDAADQQAAHDRGAFAGPRGQATARLGALTIWHLTGKTAPQRAGDVCVPGAIVVMDGYWRGGPPACRLFDARALARTGALALSPAPGGGLALRSARASGGHRLWNDRTLRAFRLGN
ncbi:MAG: ComEC/Rec2 family competence protein, partial [Rhodobacteraceae bacterium]|nr:ComEC/Rec2 family competence protein [Paracoccaceae bacterium]